MSTTDKAEIFARLHDAESPLIIYNAWDAGSATTIADAGAQAIGTSSWAVAEAHGYRDGESIPLALVEQVVARIASICELPVTVDFEGGYSENDAELARNVSRLIDLGVAGINFEDRVVRGSGLYPSARHAERIATVRELSDSRGAGLFINARTDLFLNDNNGHVHVLEAAIERGRAYASAGASGFFVPGLSDDALIARICREVPLPVNIMVGDVSPAARFSSLGVSRISYGPTPYISTLAALRESAASAFQSLLAAKLSAYPVGIKAGVLR